MGKGAEPNFLRTDPFMLLHQVSSKDQEPSRRGSDKIAGEGTVRHPVLAFHIHSLRPKS